MHIEFTIGWAFIEFACHFCAFFCYSFVGYCIGRPHENNEGGATAALLTGLLLTAIGAHL